MNYKRKSRRRFFLFMRSRIPTIYSEFRGLGYEPPPSTVRRWIAAFQGNCFWARRVCGRCSWCRDFPTCEGYYGKMVHLTGCFSRSFLVTRNCRLNSLRTWVSSRVRSSVISANEIRRAQPTRIILTDIGGDVERVLLGSGIVGRRPLGTGIPPFLKFMHIVASKDWSRVQLTSSADTATWFSSRRPHFRRGLWLNYF